MDKNKCDICGNLATYGDGKTWCRCFTHLNDHPAMDTSKDIQTQIEYKIQDVLTNGNYINGITACEISDKLSPLIVQLFKEYIEAQQAYSVWPTTDPKDLKYLDKAQVLEGLEKEVI